jgi:predicted RNA-binding Zn-ribbon protein involved in translation (DUF1610 family)
VVRVSEGEVAEILSEGANESTMLARVFRHVEDRPVAPRAEDFYAALKYDPAIVVRIHWCQTAIDCRYRDGKVEYVHEFRDPGQATRQAFLFDARCADEIEVLAHTDSQFGEGYTCADCGEESFDPDSEFVTSRNTVRVTCPECGAVDEVPQGSDPPRDLATDGGQPMGGTDRSSPCPDYSEECGFVTNGRCAVCDFGRDRDA